MKKARLMARWCDDYCVFMRRTTQSLTKFSAEFSEEFAASLNWGQFWKQIFTEIRRVWLKLISKINQKYILLYIYFVLYQNQKRFRKFILKFLFFLGNISWKNSFYQVLNKFFFRKRWKKNKILQNFFLESCENFPLNLVERVGTYSRLFFRMFTTNYLKKKCQNYSFLFWETVSVFQTSKRVSKHFFCRSCYLKFRKGYFQKSIYQWKCEKNTSMKSR